MEAGIKNLRVHFVRETEAGVTPADPAWLRYSDVVMSTSFGPSGNIYAQMPIGTPDVNDFLPGPEDHTFNINYHLQRWLAAAGDAAYDGMHRIADGSLPGTHSVLIRQELAGKGTAGGGRRIYTYGVGGRIGTVRLPGNPDSGEPIPMQLAYRFEKMRSHVIDQPAAAIDLVVVSTDAGDTTQNVTFEDDNAATSETVTLNGTSLVQTVATFASLDAVWLDAPTKGNVEVYTNGGNDTTPAKGDLLMVIQGSDSYKVGDGDQGIPLLGTGSFEGALGTAFEQVIGDTITWDGSDLEDNVLAMEITVENNLEATPRLDSRSRRITEGGRDIGFTATVFSEKGSHDAILNHLKTKAGDLVWTLTGGSITIAGAVLTSPGERLYESRQAVMRRDNGFTGKSLTIA